MRVLIFGDSITQGFWDTEGGWASRLRRYYDEKQVQDLKKNDEPTIFNLGISGGNSGTILERFENEVRVRKNREEMAIIICTGVNDSCLDESKKYMVAPDKYEANLQELAKQAKNFTNKIMFLGLVAGDDSLTMPVFWRKIYYPNERIKMYESIMASVAKKENITFVPVHDQFKKQLDQGRNLLADGLHPNNDGHEYIFRLTKPALESML